MIPAAFEYQRPASVDEALRPSDTSRRGKGHRRRPEPAAAPQAAPGERRHAHRHRPAGRAQGAGPDRRRGLRGRCAGDLRRAHQGHLAQLGGRGHGAHRRRPGPQSRHGRRLDRPLRPGLGPARDGAGARLLGRAPLAARRTDRSARRLLRGPVPDRDGARRAARSRSSGDPCQPAPRAPTGSSPSPRPATRSWASPRSRRWMAGSSATPGSR